MKVIENTEAAANDAHVVPQKWTRRALLRSTIRGGIGAASLGLGGLAWANKVEPNRWTIERRTLRLRHLPIEFDGFTIAQLSDFHWDEEPRPERLHDIVEAVNALSPDLVALTGDYVTLSPRSVARVMSEALGLLRARHGVFAVLGNHDQWRASDIRRMLREGGVRELRNAVHPLRRGQSTLWVCGLDSTLRKRQNLKAVLAALPTAIARRNAENAALLLVHEPDFADQSAKSGAFDLQLSGHSHGGQVRLPIRGPLILPTGGRKYHSGLYRVENAHGAMWQYTNRGLGSMGLRLRFFCPPEISLLTLLATEETRRNARKKRATIIKVL